MDDIAALTPTFASVSYNRFGELAPEGTPIMHVERRARRKGQFR